MLVQVKPNTNNKRSCCSLWGVMGIENTISELGVQACIVHFNRAFLHKMKIKFPLTGGNCAGMLPST